MRRRIRRSILCEYRRIFASCAQTPRTIRVGNEIGRQMTAIDPVMTPPFRMLSALIRRIVRSSGRAPARNLVATLVLCIVGAVYAGLSLRFNTEPDALFARDLPFRVAEDEFYRLFPGEADVIVVVIDGPSTASAQRAADRLTTTLSSARSLFNSVRQPTGGDFFERNGLLYTPLGELQALSKTLVDTQPLLGTLS